jgi:hypothetical protein
MVQGSPSSLNENQLISRGLRAAKVCPTSHAQEVDGTRESQLVK